MEQGSPARRSGAEHRKTASKQQHQRPLRAQNPPPWLPSTPEEIFKALGSNSAVKALVMQPGDTPEFRTSATASVWCSVVAMLRPHLPPPASFCSAPLAAGSLAVLLAALLAGCSSTPRTGGDGPEARPPPNLHQVPDAVPRIDAQRSGGPNKPYEVLGQAYTPLTGDPVMVERGLASWYGRKFHGRSTANGETYDMYAMTGAHKTMPLPSYARVRNPANGREVVLRINDRGPFHADRVIDLSYTAALKLGLLAGVAPVELERITHDTIRSGQWQGSVLAQATAESVLQAQPARAPVPAPQREATAGFWLQFGAFRDPMGASGLAGQLRDQAQWLAPLLAVFSERGLHRLQAGPYASRAEANSVAEQLRATGRWQPAIVERR